MPIPDPARMSPAARGLGCFAAVALGTAVGFATGGIAAVSGVAVAGLFTSALAADLGKIWEQRSRDPKYGPVRDDLTKLIGNAIARVLYDCAGSKWYFSRQSRWYRALAKVAIKRHERFLAHWSFDEIAGVESQAARERDHAAFGGAVENHTLLVGFARL